MLYGVNLSNDWYEDIWNRIHNDNQDITLKYDDAIWNGKLITIEDTVYEMCNKSLTNFWLPALNKNKLNN